MSVRMTKQLTVVKLSSVHNVTIDHIEKDGHFITAYRDGDIVAGFSTEAVDEFYVREIGVLETEGAAK